MLTYNPSPPTSHAHPESTTIALLARLSGLMEPLREFVKTKSVWGTCAGAILLARAVSNPKKGGQELLGGVSIKIARNGWGSQVRVASFLSPFFVVGRTEMIDQYGVDAAG
jgi:pyridoxal 5'-phosphate synthase pdxT subunit